VTTDVKSWVRFVRWPAESKIREECRARRRLCLLVVEHGAPPPERIGLYEDWVRPPIVPEDLQARVSQLEARVVLNEKPVLDPAGILFFRDSSVTLSMLQCEILSPLISRYCQVVYRNELGKILEQCGASASSNAIDLHVLRLRRRLQPLGLTLRNVWGRGFTIEPNWQN
jgi:DNA-binding response OmpR family regulator